MTCNKTLNCDPFVGKEVNINCLWGYPDVNLSTQRLQSSYLKYVQIVKGNNYQRMKVWRHGLTKEKVSRNRKKLLLKYIYIIHIYWYIYNTYSESYIYTHIYINKERERPNGNSGVEKCNNWNEKFTRGIKKQIYPENKRTSEVKDRSVEVI